MPPLWQLLAVVPVTVLLVAALTAIPARISARRPSRRCCSPSSPEGAGAPAPERSAGRFLLDRALRGRDGLEALVGDRLAALDREPVRARGEPLLGTLERRELRLEVLRAAGVELVLIEVL